MIYDLKIMKKYVNYFLNFINKFIFNDQILLFTGQLRRSNVTGQQEVEF